MKKLYFVLLTLLLAGGLNAQCTANFTATADGDGGYWFRADSVGDSTAVCTWKVWHDSTAIPLDSTGREVFYDFPANDTFSICLHVEDTANACSSDTCLQFIVTEKYVPLLDSVNIWSVHFDLCYMQQQENPWSRADCDYQYYYYPFGSIYTIADTLIDTLSYKILMSTNPNWSGQICYFGFIREDINSRQVFFKDVLGNPEILLYDFSKKPGDSIYIEIFPGASNSILGSGYYKVLLVSEAQLQNGPHRVFTLAIPNQAQSTISWIEGVGFLGNPVYPYIRPSFSGCITAFCGTTLAGNIIYGFPSWVACYSHSTNVYFDTCSYNRAQQSTAYYCFALSDSCNYGLVCGGVEQLSSLASFEISPNPASSVATAYLQVKQSEDFSLEVQDLQGKLALPLVKLGRLHEGAQQSSLDVQALPSGTYLVACRTAQGALYRKLVIAR